MQNCPLVEIPTILHFASSDQVKSDSGWLEIAQIAFQGPICSWDEKLLIAGNGSCDILNERVGIFGVIIASAATPHESGDELHFLPALDSAIKHLLSPEI